MQSHESRTGACAAAAGPWLDIADQSSRLMASSVLFDPFLYDSDLTRVFRCFISR